MARLSRWIIGGLLIVIGLLLLAGGARLLMLGGSIYYVLAGLACLASGVLIVRGSAAGKWLYALFLLATVLWSLAEVGGEFWQLLPRLAGPAILGILIMLVPVRDDPAPRWAHIAVLAIAPAVLLGLLGTWLVSGPNLDGAPVSRAAAALATTADWQSYGGTAKGTRHSDAAQIRPDNVGQLERVWSYRTGDSNALRPDISNVMSFQTTPIMVRDRLYFCTPPGAVIALDADSGEALWRHDPKSNPGAAQMMNCRGVSYHERGGTETCARRILSTTTDGRLIALDADSGERCEGFGTGGEISLAEGLGDYEAGSSYTTSPPVIIGDVAVLGAYVRDNFRTGEASGVVRAIDAVTGKLLWAWDAGRAEDAGPLEDGETYTSGSPNAWTVLSADPELGLVYVPTGNATPDHVGMHRTERDDKYSSALVALDAETGRPRWHFQTVHHDLWDYDLPAQPALFDLPASGDTIPAIAVPTKRGEIFILDRRDGRPLKDVEERPVPQGNVAGESYSPTQPYQRSFPSLAPPPLKESDMWGATPLDQLWCRISYRAHDYAGEFTPPSMRGAIQYPGLFGALNWGSVSIDEQRGLLIANSSAIPHLVRLYPKEAGSDPAANSAEHGAGYLNQDGTPYGLTLEAMLSPLGLPCQAPPWGKLTAIDLKSDTIAWQRPLGTSEDVAPMGIAVPGIFSIGGPVTTASGLVFIGATLDDYLRAFDVRTGRELWKGRLPAGGQATPMTYVSNKTGRQYVVIAAGGHGFMGTTLGDHVVAFALPDRADAQGK